MGDTALRRVAVLIPAYRPDKTLTLVVEQLAALGFPNIVVVNDGSGPECDPVFAAVAQIDGVRIVRHAVNLGKGAALKTGINHALCLFPEITGIVTADADGQHLPDDIVRVAERLLENPDALILGARAFDGDVPLRSRFGNSLTRDVMQSLVGQSLTDTQTGLRGIPTAFAKSLLRLTSSGYEFELDMLVSARQGGIEVIEQRIQTVYEPGNKSSHFNPLADSMRIYFVLLRFTAASLVTALLDNLIFYVAWHAGAHLLAAQILARTVAATFNYIVVRRAVFQIRGSHANTLPRFLALVAAMGTVSYTFIHVLIASGHLSVFSAKVAVESLLFLANFTVQRDWVFRQTTGGEVSDSEAPAPFRWKTAPLWLLLLVPLAFEVYGFRIGHLLRQDNWLPEGAARFAKYTECFVVGTLLFGLFARRYFVPCAATAVVLCSVWAVGPAPVFAVALFVFSATVAGRLLFGESTSGLLAFAGGLGVWIAAMYATAALPVHYPATYLAVFLLPVAIGFRQATRLGRQWFDVFRPRLLTLSEFLPVALLAFVLIANWLIVLKPEVSADGLAMHLTIPANIALHHAYTIDFRQLIWALMPVGADFSFAAVYMLGGEYAARLLNFAILLSTALLVLQCLRSFVSTAAATLLAALFVSTPLVYLITGSLFVENFVGFVVLAAIAALWQVKESRTNSNIMLAELLLGTAMALKIGALTVGLPGLVILGVTGFRRRDDNRPAARHPWLLVAATALALGVGLTPYVKAWTLTGNPLFPFETGPFRSTLITKDTRDLRYNHPLTFRTPYDLTFHTDRYHEGRPGSFGFQYLLFLPLIGAALLAIRSFRSRTMIGLGIAAALTVAVSQPNARYFFFTTPILTVGIGIGLSWIREKDRLIFRALIAAAVVAAAANIWFLPSGDWYHREFYTTPLFSEAGRTAYRHAHAPVRDVIDWLNARDRDQAVIFTDASDIAGVVPPVYMNHWHNEPFREKILAAAQPEDVLGLFRNAGIHWMIVNRDEHKPRTDGTPDAVDLLIATCGVQRFASESIAALELRPDCEAAIRLARLECPPGNPARPAIAAGSGPGLQRVDETDPRITFIGKWIFSRDFPRTYNSTITLTDAAGAAACFVIDGSGFNYVYTQAFNRGVAQILIDGKENSTLDLYNPAIFWQSKFSVKGLAPGRHDVEIRVAHRKTAASKDYVVDFDGIEVF